MNAMNNFTVTGYICKDADVKNFDKAAIARFGIIIKHSERRGNETVTVSSILSLETWVKKGVQIKNPCRKKKEVTIEGFFKPESYTKDGKNVTVLKNVATKITPYVRDKKQDGPKEEKKKKKA